MKPPVSDLDDRLFAELSDLIHRLCGITLHEGKRELLQARLGKRMRALGLATLREYLEHVRRDDAGVEITAMLDAISTNKTSFYREADHFVYLEQVVLPRLIDRGRKRLRIWSAGCSSGEEPYTIAITSAVTLPRLSTWDVRILATDISTRVLAEAREGIYDAARVAAVPPHLRTRSFEKVGAQTDPRYQVKRELRALVTFCRLNLMVSWPMRGPVDAVFCRNVMIYFDRPTRERLVGRFWSLLERGGAFFVGHSESLTGVQHQFRYVQPAVYEKP